MHSNATLKGLTADENELRLINQLTMKDLTAKEVFVFKLALCDNEVDRDVEQFSDSCLIELAEMFKGRTVIADHMPKASNQSARIYDTTVEQVVGKSNSIGQQYKRLVAKCYMPLTKSNEDLITEINAGIKKEVSVNVSVKEINCSICGANRRKELCSHQRGEEYNGSKCYFILNDASDAYEVSFVAVPAQKEAGVTKNHIKGNEELDISKQLEIEKIKTQILLKF